MEQPGVDLVILMAQSLVTSYNKLQSDYSIFINLQSIGLYDVRQQLQFNDAKARCLGRDPTFLLFLRQPSFGRQEMPRLGQQTEEAKSTRATIESIELKKRRFDPRRDERRHGHCDRCACPHFLCHVAY